MAIDDNLFSKLENLSSLKIDKDREKLIKQIDEVVGFVKNLNEIDTSNQTILEESLLNSTPLREDVVLFNTELIESIFAHAPKTKDNLFCVPKIIE